MKKLTIVIAFLPFVFAVILGGCGGSGSGPSASDPVVSENTVSITTKDGGSMLDTDTDLSTGVSGFTIDHVYLIDGDDKKISGREVALNSTFSIVYQGVKNYTLKDGKAFPDLSIQVIDNNQKTVLSETDLLASYTDGLSVEDASFLRATVTVGNPMTYGKYICSVQVVDKNNNNSAILSTWEFEVK